jgi:hypothetical protein
LPEGGAVNRCLFPVIQCRNSRFAICLLMWALPAVGCATSRGEVNFLSGYRITVESQRETP